MTYFDVIWCDVFLCDTTRHDTHYMIHYDIFSFVNDCSISKGDTTVLDLRDRYFNEGYDEIVHKFSYCDPISVELFNKWQGLNQLK